MKTKKENTLTLAYDADLAKKFQEASQRKASIDDFVKDFLCQYVAGATKRAYMKDLMLFFDFLKKGRQEINSPKDIQSFHFQIYRDDMMDRGLASATVNRRLVAIRSFIKWSIAQKLIDFNPLDSVKLPKVQTEQETLAFDDDEAIAMIKAADTTKHKGRTHRLSMVLLFNLGLRRSELVNIRIRDIYEERGHVVLQIRGKGDKTRIMPLADYVLNEIQDYIRSIALGPAKVELQADDFLLQSSNLGRKNEVPIDGSSIYRMIQKYARLLGINKRVSPHSCRATAISHLLDAKKATMRDVASFAGHANITTTERYDKRRGELNNSAAYAMELHDK